MRLTLIFLLFFSLYGENLEITKVINHSKTRLLIEHQGLDKNFKNMLQTDLKVINHFDYRLSANLEKFEEYKDFEKYTDYDYLLRIKQEEKQLKATLFHIKNKKNLLNKSYSVPEYSYYPFLVHTLVNDVNEKSDQKSTDFLTKLVVYSINSAPKEAVIYIADYTFTYKKRIIKGGLNIFPKWADEAHDSFYYTSLEKTPVLYKYNLKTGKKSKLMSSNGMLVVSDAKKDQLLLTMAVDDQPDIYLYNIETNKYNRLTQYSGIDVNGRFFGENNIVFVSNRLGYPNIYELNIDNKKVSRVLYHGKNHHTVTTYKDYLIVSSRESNEKFHKNTFNLFLTKKDDPIIKRLTFEGKNINPKFSDDGTTVLFMKTFKFTTKIGIIRLNESKLFYFNINKKLQSFDW